VDLHDQSTDLDTTGLRNCVTWRQTFGEAPSDESANKYIIGDNKPHIKLKADFVNLCSQWPNNIHVALNVSCAKNKQMHINKIYFILSYIIIYFIKYSRIK